MAELPKYERQKYLTEGVPMAGTENIDAAITASKSMQSMLDQLTAYTAEEAGKYAIEKGIEFSINNPLSIKDYQNAERNGESAVNKFLQGGKTYNNTLKTMYGHQSRIDLLGELENHQQGVLQQVKEGKITDLQQIRAELEAPTKGYANVVFNIDAEEGMKFQTSATTYTKTNYKSILKELGDRAELEAQFTVDKFITAGAKNYTQFVYNNTDPTLLLAHRDMLERDAFDAFAITGKQTENMNAFRNKLDKVEEAAVADQIAKEYFTAGSSKEQVERIMQNEGEAGRYTNYFANLLPDRQNSLQSAVSTAMEKLEISSSVSNKTLTFSLSEMDKTVSNGNLTDLSQLSGYDFDDKQQIQADIILGKQLINEVVYSSSPYNEAGFDAAMTKIQTQYGGEQNTIYEDAILQHADKMRKQVIKEIEETPIEYLKKNIKYKSEIEPLYVDSNMLIDPEYRDGMARKIAKRKAVVEKFAEDFGLANVNLFSKEEVSYYSNQFNQITQTPSLTPTEKVGQQMQYAGYLVDTFGGNSYQIFQELGEKNTSLAHIGNLMNDAMRSPNPSMEAGELLAVGNLIDLGVAGDKAKYVMETSDMRTTEASVLGDAFTQNERGIVTESAIKIYYALKTKDFDEFDTDLYEKALKLAAGQQGEYGGIVEYKGVKHAIPSNIKRDDFEDNLFRFATIEDIEANLVDRDGNNIENIGRGSQPYSYDQFVTSNLKFVDNTKAMLSGEIFRLFGNEELAFGDPNGNPIYIDMANLYELILSKNPGLDEYASKRFDNRDIIPEVETIRLMQ